MTSRRLTRIVLPLLAAAFVLLTPPRTGAQSGLANVKISTSPLHQGRISPMLYGGFVELLNDHVPGMWAEMLGDRGFEGILPTSTWDYFRGEPDLCDRDWDKNPDWTYDTDRPFNDKQSCRLEAGKGKGAARLTQSALAVRKGMAYLFSGWWRASSPSPRVRVSLKAELPDGNWTTLASATEVGSAGPDWRRFSGRLVSRGTTDRAIFEVEVAGTGRLWLDKLSLMPEDNVEGWRRDVVDAVKELGPPVLRWGGSTVDPGPYRWAEAIGERDRRPSFVNRVWGRRDTNDVGVEEFVRLCRIVGAEPLVCMSLGDGVDNARRLVEYLNGAADSEWGRKRASNGRAEPYGVRYVQVGNEITTPGYGQRLIEFARAVRAVDPAIQVLSSFPTKEVVEEAGPELAILCPHYYQPDLDGVDEDLRKIEGWIKASAGRDRLRVGVTEWNIDAGDWGLGRGKLSSLRCALFEAQFLNLLHRHSDFVVLACRSNMTNSFNAGTIQTNAAGLYRTPGFLNMAMFRKHSKPVPLRVSADLPAAVDVTACASEDRSAVTVFLVNTRREPVRVVLDLSDFGPDFAISGGEVVKDSQDRRQPDIVNSFANPGRVVRVPLEIQAGNTVTLPALSTAALECSSGVGSSGAGPSKVAVEAQPSQEPPSAKLAEVPGELAPVDFLAAAPVIDGVLDPGLRGLSRRMFSQVDFFGPATKPVETHYRLAYGADFLYVYVEAQGDKLTFNDRAYQNGDGFHMVIARALPGNAPTREFYVAACSAVNRPELEWSRRLFWYYNVDKIFVPMSRQAKMEAAAHDGVISFELFLPWQDLHPYHPWLSEGIGFNLGFVKNVGEGAQYYRVLPEDLGQENAPRRYIPLRFANPVPARGIQTFVRLERNHIRQGESLNAESVTLSAGPATETLAVTILSGEGTRLESTSTEYACAPGLTRHQFNVKLGDLPPGGYRAAWSSPRGYVRGDDSTRASGLTILPRSDIGALEKRLAPVASRLSPGSATTIRFLLEETKTALDSMPLYETAAKERLSLVRLEEALAQAGVGRDVFAERTGYFRRAYRSRVDGTLQPYAVRIPEGYDPRADKTYPLIVYLHGSASDETNLAGVDYLGGGDFIELAPRGRGPSNAYTRDHAQDDIEEAVEAVIQSYPIDTKRIVLTGFSMGGYGVYRTFYEHPERYKTLAVFSGAPDLGNQYFPGEGHPSFLDERNLAKFKGVPIFIFHGLEDRNCPYAVMQELAKKLERAGAVVEFVTEPGAGHQRPGPETLRRYHEWLKKF